MPWLVYPLVAVGIAVMVLLPRLTSAIPAPLVAIVVLTLFTVLAAVTVPTVGDEGALPDSLPTLFLPHVPLSLDTLRIIAPYALAMALVGLLESLMTARLVDDVTDTPSHKTREAWGQGVANVVTGFFGGMGGCAMIGQTMINVKASGARTRHLHLPGRHVPAGPRRRPGRPGQHHPDGRARRRHDHGLVSAPSTGTASGPTTLRRMPRSETLVMLATVVVVVATHNLAIGVVVGVLSRW